MAYTARGGWRGETQLAVGSETSGRAKGRRPYHDGKARGRHQVVYPAQSGLGGVPNGPPRGVDVGRVRLIHVLFAVLVILLCVYGFIHLISPIPVQ